MNYKYMMANFKVTRELHEYIATIAEGAGECNIRQVILE